MGSKTSLLLHIGRDTDDIRKSFLHYGIEKELKSIFIYVNV